MLNQLFSKIKEMFGNSCYYPGCLTRFALPEIEQNYVKILKALEIDFVQMPDSIMCCGAPAYNAGYEDVFSSHKEKLISWFKQYDVNKIITNCPTCSSFLKDKYNYNVYHVTQIIAKHLPKLAAIASSEKITFHDPCHLGRYSNIYNEPRDILKAMGFQVVEMRDNKERALCCGAGAGLRNSKPGLSKDIAKKRIQQIVEAGTKKAVTCCPMCYVQLKENAPAGIEVYELSELLVRSLNIHTEPTTGITDTTLDEDKD